ncbi:MAG TPA: plastocyanin/azurin family copper-binding protein [Nitriliruptorales bacterium]
MRRSTIRLAAVAVAGLLLAACGAGNDTASENAAPPDAEQTQGDEPGDGGDATGTEMGDMDDDMDMGDDMDMSGAYGEPADASEAGRTIEVTVDNDLVFEPAEYEVAAGEVVTFRISNTGDIEHEFVLGDEQAQQQMADEMGEGDGHAPSGGMSNAVTIHPGEEAELTWLFPDEATTVLVGCHVPGHYEAGMRGTVTVG